MTRPLVLGAIGALLLIGAARWFLSERVEQVTDTIWDAACATDLQLVPAERRAPLEQLVRLANELDRLAWSERWSSLASSPLGWVVADPNDIRGLDRRSRQVRDDLRGALEQLNAQLDRVVSRPGTERAATLRLLAFGRWRLQGGSYDDAVRFYDARTNEIARRPTPTATPTATVSPTPTKPSRRRPPPRRRAAPTRPRVVDTE
ncbi:MAG TPA: hypothetical protein VEB21_21040 [Terriglobales bacterium]|nr:hypothetical protein [Terriglobales bacterium]